MNDDSLLSAPLRDRLRILEIPSYSPTEKREILRLHLLPDALENIGLSRDSVTLTSDAARAILAKTTSTRNDGVRLLNQVVTKIVSRINFLRSVTLPDGSTGDLSPSFKIPCQLPLTLTAAQVDQLWTRSDCSGDPPFMMYL